MTNQHPITPPPELVLQWQTDWHHSKSSYVEIEVYIATEAARWGADQELEECWRWMRDEGYRETAQLLHSARRHKQPSLKEQALEALEQLLRDPEAGCFSAAPDTIRRALEALPND